MNEKKLLTVTVTVAITTMFALASNLTFLSMNVMTKTAFAQVPPAPVLPNGGDSTTDYQLPDTKHSITTTTTCYSCCYKYPSSYYSNYFPPGR
jgi:hypothetical protein